ncbi:hypothetical protein FRC12_021151 [Ceratobasidium sp. 428]|nr:hypothetical protein FRC12_021151 [Ceratobasidium sp. 428]
MDGGIVASFKAQYQRRFIRYALDQNERGVSAEKMYKLNQLEGMRLALAAWDAVTPQTIHHCWRHVGLVPTTPPFYAPPPPALHEFAGQNHMHGYLEPIQPVQDNYNLLQYLLPDDAEALGQFNMRFETEGTWTDEQLVALFGPNRTQ